MTVYTVTTLDDPSATGGTSANGINNTGQIVGSYSVATVSPLTHQGYGFLYNRQDGTYTTLEDPHTFHGGVAPGTSAQGINDLGQVVGYYAGLYNGVGGTHGFLYTGGTYSTLDAPGATRTQAYGINNAGQISGSYSDGTTNHGFLYNGTTYTTLDVPGADQTSAYGINNAGQVVGSYYSDASGGHGFLYSGGTYTNIDYPSATGTQPLGINDLGHIVGVYTTGSGAGVSTASSTAAASTRRWTIPRRWARHLHTASTTAMSSSATALAAGATAS
jgi:probable HAF family extracellular repeat protein